MKAARSKTAPTPLDLAFTATAKLERELFTFNEDMNVLAWACDALWHYEFGYDTKDSNERLSQFPTAVVRMAAVRSQTLVELCKREVFPGESWMGDGTAWLNSHEQNPANRG